MININNIKTIPQSIDHLNRVILGMSETNQVIPKAYNSALPVQERLDGLEDRMAQEEEKSNDALTDIAVLNGIAEELLIATEDTGWQPLTITNESVSTDPTKAAMFIRKIGNVVSIIGRFEFISTYIQHPPLGYLAQLPPEYRPFRDTQSVVVTYIQGTESEAQLKINSENGYLTLNSGHTPNTEVHIRNLVYLVK